MALTAVRTTPGTSGARTVTYRGPNGKTADAVILGAGTTSGVKIKLVHITGTTERIIDNVELATARTETNVYWWRT